MSSLAEMMDYANYSSQNTPQGDLAGTLQSGIGGYLAGQASKEADQKQQLDTALKIIDMHEKYQKMQIEQRKQTLNENMMKSFGLIPPDASDHSAAVETGWNRLGPGKDSQNPNTPQGKLASMAQNLEWRPSWSVSGGVSMSAHPKKTATESTAQGNLDNKTQMETLAIANKIAVAKKVKTMQASDPHAGTMLAQKIDPAKVTVGPDEVMAAMPMAHALRTNNKAEYSKLMANVPPPPEPNPVDGLMAQVAQQAAQLKQLSERTLWQRLTNSSGTPASSSSTNTGSQIPDARKRLLDQTAARKKTASAPPSIWDTQPTSTSNGQDNEE